MARLQGIPRIGKEIIITIVSFFALWALWNFAVKDYAVISDQALSTIGIALSTSVGIVTAIVVSFVLMTWQSGRQERSTSFWRWRNTLHQFFDFCDTNFEVLKEIWPDVMELTQSAAAVALIAPMPREKFKELYKKISDKLGTAPVEQQEIKEPSQGDLLKARVYMRITDYLVLLTHTNFEHNLAHYLYRRVLSLRGLLYRLLVVLIASILVVVIGVTKISIEISDVLNAPLTIVLIGWVIYVLICLAREIRRTSLLEDELSRQEKSSHQV